MIKKKIISTGLILASSLFILSGCNKIDPTPPAIDVEAPLKKANVPNLMVSVKKGETLKEVIQKIQENNKEYIIIDKVNDEIVFDRDIEKISTEELKKYIKVSLNKNINFRKFSEQIITVEERIIRDKKDFSIVGTYKLPKKEIIVDEQFTYAEVFALLRESNINIYTDIYNAERFDLGRTVPQFKGDIKDFLDFVASKERLFIVVEDNAIKLKDVQTVTYNLKLPKIDLAPALSSDGRTSVVSVGSAISGTVNGTETNGGSIDPLKSLEDQIKEMVPADKVKFNVNKTNGTLSVTGDYESIKIIDMLVEDFQSIYDSAIKIELHIYQIELNDSNAFGIDFNLLKNQLVGDTIQATKNISTGLTGALSLTATEGSSLNINNNNGILLGTESNGVALEKTQGLIFKNLNKFGKTSVLTKPTLGTINNLPVSLDVVDSLDYVAKIERGSSTSSTESGLGTSSESIDIDIENVTTGYSVVLHPKIDGEFIQVAIKNVTSVLNALTPYKYMDGETENVLYLKNVSAKQFSETVKVKEGEIAIIGGFLSTKDYSLKNGLPFTTGKDSAFDAFTSAKERSEKKFEIIITISATII
jgi:general secretion pathway protein D